jgi:3-hydroxyacyl-[acyl-carrier-protein] dehydratase
MQNINQTEFREAAPDSPLLAVHADHEYHYPMQLDQTQLQRFIPHRAPMLFAHSVTVLAQNHFLGKAVWQADSFVFQGHFPGQPLVPGVMIIEAAAQIAGVGVLAGDPVARPKSATRVGLLAGVRKCFFKRPVTPGQVLTFDLHSRQMAEDLANISGEVTSANEIVATLEFAFVQASITSVTDRL